MKKTLVVATSLAALSACSQMDPPQDEAQAANGKPSANNIEPGAQSAALINVNPFLFVPDENNATVVTEVGDSSGVTENTQTHDDVETVVAATNSETTAPSSGGWVVYSQEILDANDQLPPTVVAAIEQRQDDVVVAPETAIASPEADANDRLSFVDGGPVFFDVLLEGQFSSITQQQLVVIRDQLSFDQLWADHNATPQPIEQPSVDFAQNMVIAIFRGTTAQCGEQLSVSRILASDTLDVHATISTADTDAQCFIAEQDFVWVTVKQTDKLVNLHTHIMPSIVVTPVAPRLNFLRDKIELTYRHIVENIGTATCYDNSQCAALALGANACGGPQSYLAFSTYNTDIDYLNSLAAEHRDTSQLANQRAELTAACQFVSEPLVACRVDQCVLDTETINIRDTQLP